MQGRESADYYFNLVAEPYPAKDRPVVVSEQTNPIVPVYKDTTRKLVKAFELLRTRDQIGDTGDVPARAALRRDLPIIERASDRANGQDALAAVRAVMRVPNTRKRAKPKPKYQSKKNKSLKWTGRGMLPTWMREEMKGTKLTKDSFLIK